MSDSQPQPYQTLGRHLRYLREQNSESLAEVSGAVEIDEHCLERIEDGHERPAEDILMLLINHFDMQDQEAVQLWELAGYDGSTDRSPIPKAEEIAQEVITQKSLVVVVGMENKVLYTDDISIDINKSGLVMRFSQSNKKQQQTVAQLGMSYDQAREVLRSLQSALLHAKYNNGPKQLPPSLSD